MPSCFLSCTKENALLYFLYNCPSQRDICILVCDICMFLLAPDPTMSQMTMTDLGEKQYYVRKVSSRKICTGSKS